MSDVRCLQDQLRARVRCKISYSFAREAVRDHWSLFPRWRGPPEMDQLFVNYQKHWSPGGSRLQPQKALLFLVDSGTTFRCLFWGGQTTRFKGFRGSGTSSKWGPNRYLFGIPAEALGQVNCDNAHAFGACRPSLSRSQRGHPFGTARTLFLNTF